MKSSNGSIPRRSNLSTQVKDADAQAALEIEDATAKVRDEGDTAATVDRDLQDNFADSVAAMERRVASQEKYL